MVTINQVVTMFLDHMTSRVTIMFKTRVETQCAHLEDIYCIYQVTMTFLGANVSRL